MRDEPAETAEPMGLEPIRIVMPSGFEDIVPDYLETRKHEVCEMIELLSASNFERLAQLGHQLRGSGGPMDFRS